MNSVYSAKMAAMPREPPDVAGCLPLIPSDGSDLNLPARWRPNGGTSAGADSGTKLPRLALGAKSRATVGVGKIQLQPAAAAVAVT